MKDKTASLIKQARGCYHQNLLDSILTISNSGIPSRNDTYAAGIQTRKMDNPKTRQFK